MRSVSSSRSSSEPLAPSWYRNAQGAQLPDDCRVKCEVCHGHGASSYYEMLACSSCTRGPHNIPCPIHSCRACIGSGMVCPTCRGMRFVRSSFFKMTASAHDSTREITRCPVCCEGNNVNIDRERDAIQKYLLKYRTWQADAAARGEPFVEPTLARQLNEQAEQWRMQQEYASQDAERRRTRQKRHITRSRAVEARMTDLPPAPLPQNMDLLRGILQHDPNSERERKRRATLEREQRGRRAE